MQSKAWNSIRQKVAGTWKLPENARVVAAGNELGDSLVANEMAEPLYDRFAHVNIETTNKRLARMGRNIRKHLIEKLDYKNKMKQDKKYIQPYIHLYHIKVKKH